MRSGTRSDNIAKERSYESPHQPELYRQSIEGVAMDMIEKVARAISGHIGPEFDAAYAHKDEWTADRGSRADINAPFKSDYLEAACAAIEALMEPTEGMIKEGGIEGGFDAYRVKDNTLEIWRSMLKAALEEGK